MRRPRSPTRMALALVLALAAAGRGRAQDTRPDSSADSLRRYTLAPVTVSVTRTAAALTKVPLAVSTLERAEIRRGRQTLGLDEALAALPGVHVANRYNFSLDQRLSIRGFGSRSAFSIRGVKVLLDGIPQTLPDGQSQLTNVELAAVDRIEVLRGASSALYGNASGGVISLSTTPPTENRPSLLVEAGTFDNDLRRTWNKWQAGGTVTTGRHAATYSVSRLWWQGPRQHSTTESWRLNTRYSTPLGTRTSASVQLSLGSDPRADNPGALTQAEDAVNRDSAAAINLTTRAGKEVLQLQGGLSVRRQLERGDLQATVFGLTRNLENPLPQAYITLDRRAYGLRVTGRRLTRAAGLPLSLTGGLDAQWQRDDRVNYGNVQGRPDSADVRLDQFERVAELGPFVEGVLEPSPDVALTAGARFDRVTFNVDDRLLTDGDNSGFRQMSALSGSVGASFTPTPAVTAYANVATAFETPTTTELVNRPDGQGGLNLELEPQRAVSLEIGGRGQWEEGRVTWSLALFHVDVRDELVSFEDTLVPGRRFFRNAGRARHRGAEVGATAELAPGVSVVAAYTFADYRYTDYKANGDTLDGRALPGVPRRFAHLALRLEPAWLRGAWAAVDGSYSDGYFVDDTLSLRNAPWRLYNLRLGWEGRLGNAVIAPFVGIKNLRNRPYVGSVAVNAARGRYFEPAPRRNFYVGIGIRQAGASRDAVAPARPAAP